MIPSLLLWLVASLLLTMAAGAAGLWALRLHERTEQARKRIASVSSAHAYVRKPQVLSITRRTTAAPQPLLRQMGRWFGYDPARSDEGLRWYFVLPGTLLAALALSGLAGAFLGPARLLAVVPVWIGLSRGLWAWRRNKRVGLLRMQFPDALAMIVRSVRIGIPVAEAIRIVARESREPTAGVFAALANELAIGVTLEAALPPLAERIDVPEYRFFATAVSLQAQTGGGLSEALDGLSDVIRKRIALRARGYALSSEARASSIVIAILPFFVSVALYLLNPAYILTLIVDPLGRRLLAIAIFSLLFGIIAMYVIVQRVLKS